MAEDNRVSELATLCIERALKGHQTVVLTSSWKDALVVVDPDVDGEVLHEEIRNRYRGFGKIHVVRL